MYWRGDSAIGSVYQYICNISGADKASAIERYGMRIVQQVAFVISAPTSEVEPDNIYVLEVPDYFPLWKSNVDFSNEKELSFCDDCCSFICDCENQ